MFPFILHSTHTENSWFLNSLPSLPKSPSPQVYNSPSSVTAALCRYPADTHTTTCMAQTEQKGQRRTAARNASVSAAAKLRLRPAFRQCQEERLAQKPGPCSESHPMVMKPPVPFCTHSALPPYFTAITVTVLHVLPKGRINFLAEAHPSKVQLIQSVGKASHSWPQIPPCQYI